MTSQNSKLSLTLALFTLFGITGLMFDELARETVRVVIAEPGHANPTVVYMFAILMMTLFLLMISFPVLMIMAYRGLHGGVLNAKVVASLSLCALDELQLNRRIEEYQESNALSAFLLPSVLNLAILFIIWSDALLPNGVDGLLARLGNSAQVPLSLAMVLVEAAADISPLTWALLGTYFYALNLVIRRWMLSDLTTNVLWKINVRLLVAFVLGMLLMAVSRPAGANTGFSSSVAGFGFMIGIMPDILLRWLGQKLKRLGGIDARADGLFVHSDLQQKIDGMSFWQVDRLAEEGVESVHDLALKEIPSLLIKTRFDVPLLLNWVDRALLCTQVGHDLERFKRAHLYTGTALMAAVARPDGMANLLRELNGEAAGGGAPTGAAGVADGSVTFTAAMIDNILSGLASGPNLKYLANYRRNVSRVLLSPPAAPLASAPDQRADALPTAPAPSGTPPNG